MIWQPGTVRTHTVCIVCTGECFHIVDEDGANEGSSYYFGKHIRTILICCFDFVVLTKKRKPRRIDARAGTQVSSSVCKTAKTVGFVGVAGAGNQNCRYTRVVPGNNGKCWSCAKRKFCK